MVLFAKYLGMTCNKKDKNMPFDDVKIIKILIFPTEVSWEFVCAEYQNNFYKVLLLIGLFLMYKLYFFNIYFYVLNNYSFKCICILSLIKVWRRGFIFELKN